METKKEAEMIVEALKSEKTTFMGVIVPVYDYGYKMRDKIQEMVVKKEITPAVYWAALKLTPPPESDTLRRYEIEYLNS